MKMVQRKVGSNNKLCNGIHANTLKTEKKPTLNKIMMKPSAQNHEFKTKGADSKLIKMKKSRSTKWPKVELISLHSPPKPTSTPSPKTPSTLKSSSYSSPNYMKSTSSSEARKEKTTKFSSTKSSSLEKMRTLLKAPSFKHTRQRPTCSSTLKDSKFPTYLQLKPGATEAEGNSVFKVCPYTYCSLNGHHHVSAPPLKRFLSSRRRMIKTLKAVSPCKAKAEGEGSEHQDFFVKVYVPDNREVSARVSESLSDRPCSEIDFENDVDETEDTYISGMNSSLEDEDYLTTPVQRQTSFESEFFGEYSDMEWEEGQIVLTHVKCKMYVESDYSVNQEKLGFELNKVGSRYLEFIAEECTPYSHDEIMEYQHFSDTDSESLATSESNQTGGKHMEELLKDSSLADEATVYTVHLDESIDKLSRNFTQDITEAQSDEEPNSYQDLFGSDKGESNEDAANFDMERGEPSEEKTPPLTDNLETCSTKEELCMSQNDEQAESEARGSKNEDASHSNTDEHGAQKVAVEICSDENNGVEVKTSGMQDLEKTEELDAAPVTSKGESGSNLDSRNELKRLLLRCMKEHKDIEEEREFNPRGPNFLTLEADPEAEKVDLRHHEMDERRNTEEWMLDYALQKTVNQLAPDRKRKVALLVEAFESVLPAPKFQNHMTRNSAGFAHARPIQACS